MINMAKKGGNSEPEQAIVFTVETGRGYTGVNVREKPDTKSMVLYTAVNGSMVKPDKTKKPPDGWVAIQGGGYIQKDFLR